VDLAQLALPSVKNAHIMMRHQVLLVALVTKAMDLKIPHLKLVMFALLQTVLCVHEIVMERWHVQHARKDMARVLIQNAQAVPLVAKHVNTPQTT